MKLVTAEPIEDKNNEKLAYDRATEFRANQNLSESERDYRLFRGVFDDHVGPGVGRKRE